ncbi:MAG: hypothetical protein H0X13_13525 [Ramlibacter sp.]|nr:hypothetical protein [Ramlibacter sp.]
MAVAALAACGGGGGNSSPNGAPVAGSVGESGGSSTTGETGSAPPTAGGPGLVAQAPVRVNTTTAGNQFVRAIGALADGGYTVAWTSPAGSGAASSSFYIQRYDAVGNKAGAQTLIPFQFDNGAVPALTVMGDGSVVLAYAAGRTPSPLEPWMTSTGIYTRRFDAGGAAVGAETVVVSRVFNSIGDQGLHYFTNPAVVSWADGSYAVGWAYVEGNYTGVVPSFATQRYDAQGQAAGGPQFSIGSGGADVLPTFRMTAAAGGSFVFAISSRNLNRQPAFFHFSGGGRIGSFDGDTALPWDQTILLPLRDGRFALWSTNSSGPYLQMLDARGQAVGAATAVAARPTRATALRDGGYLLVFDPQGTAQRYDSASAAVGQPFMPSPWGETTALSGGGLATAWTGTSAAGDQEAMTQRFLPPN